MPDTVPLVEFLAALRRCEILSANAVEELAQLAVDAVTLARTLTQSGKLTTFQGRELLGGRGDDLAVGLPVQLFCPRARAAFSRAVTEADQLAIVQKVVDRRAAGEIARAWGGSIPVAESRRREQARARVAHRRCRVTTRCH
jgi:hypothetical protein